MRKLMILCLAAASFSSMATTSGVAFMEQMDSDDDGYITLREAVKNTDLLREFGHIDIDEDGKLDYDSPISQSTFKKFSGFIREKEERQKRKEPVLL